MVKHVVESQQFDRAYLKKLFDRADYLRHNKEETLKGKILATLFYEPSTRTRLSFEAAMMRLGGTVIGTENAKDFSSASKGETLIDTVRVVSNYCDAIVLRHTIEGSAKKASLVSGVPLINAGDGTGQHPTQTLLDLYTIKRELGRIDGLHIAIVGDLAHGRTVRSLCYLLGKFNDIKITFVSPTNLKMKEDIKEYLVRHGVEYEEEPDLNKVIGRVHVVYMTRIQKERMELREYEAARGKYIINEANLKLVQRGGIVMHPLPHTEEIDIAPTVEQEDSRVAYFRQAENGLYIRMAILEEVIL